MADILKLRRGPASQWTSRNPLLASGEPGLETDTGKFKIGDGFHFWNTLPYFIDEPATAELIQTAIEDAVLEGVPGPEGPKGDQGDPGPAGATGATGPKGDKGDTGDTGATGATGSAGESVTVTLVPAASWPPASDSNPLHLYFRVP